MPTRIDESRIDLVESIQHPPRAILQPQDQFRQGPISIDRPKAQDQLPLENKHLSKNLASYKLLFIDANKPTPEERQLSPQLIALQTQIDQERASFLTHVDNSPETNSNLLASYGKRFMGFLQGERGKTRVEKAIKLKALLEQYVEEFKKPPTSKPMQRRLAEKIEEIGRLDNIIQQSTRIANLTSVVHGQHELRKPLNHEAYKQQVTELRQLIKAGDGKNFAIKLSKLEEFDHKLREEYNGLEPYPTEHLGSTRLGTSERPTPVTLLMEYFEAEAAKALNTGSESGFLDSLQSIHDFVRYHPILAAEMAGDLAHTASLLAGNDTAGASIQTLISRQQKKNIVKDILLGSQNRSYEEECSHPPSSNQLRLIKLLRVAPGLIGALQGAAGRNLGGQLGYAVAGPLGGAVGGLLHAEGQRIVAESMSREVEIWASTISDTANITNSAKVFAEFGQILTDVDIPGAIALAGGLFQPIAQGRFARDMVLGAGNVVQDIRKDRLREAIKKSAQSRFSSTAGAQMTLPETQAAFFAANVVTLLAATKTLPDSFWEVPGTISLASFLGKSLLFDSSTETAKQVLDKLGFEKASTRLQSEKDKIAHEFASIPRSFLQSIRNLPLKDAAIKLYELLNQNYERAANKIAEQFVST